MNQKLSIGSIFSVKNDPRKLIVIGYGDNDMYIVCVCDDKKVETNKPYLIGQNQINKVEIELQLMGLNLKNSL